jgi:hypothetical protein
MDELLQVSQILNLLLHLLYRMLIVVISRCSIHIDAFLGKLDPNPRRTDLRDLRQTCTSRFDSSAFAMFLPVASSVCCTSMSAFPSDWMR